MLKIKNRRNDRKSTIFLTKNRRGALEISFGWLFALIAGAVILFFAIYFSSRLINTQQEVVSAETGKEIGILLNPLETSFESSQTTSITIPSETRIHNRCSLSGNFGEQLIQLDQQSFGKWAKTDINVIFSNKYIFSNEEIEGKKFYIFSKPFDFPFKIADLVYMTSANEVYCFVNAPDEITGEINDLNQSNLLTENCSSGGIRVCFGSSSCEINVDYEAEAVEKGEDIMYFAGTGEDSKALMYAAIFSNKDVYECQVNRLMLRTKEISKLYQDNELITAKKGCDTNLISDFNVFIDMLSNYNSSQDLGGIKMQADNIEQKNEARTCYLW
jgi:hypothetical protein